MLMIDQHASLMITVLRKDYPDIASLITAKISKSLPERSLDDLQHIDQIVSSFKNAKGITEQNWTEGKSEIKIVESRDLLLGVILMFYHPEKLMDLSDLRTKSGVLKTLAYALGTKQPVLSLRVAIVIVAFKAYEEFRLEVCRLYELIRIENKFFE